MSELPKNLIASKENYDQEPKIDRRDFLIRALVLFGTILLSPDESIAKHATKQRHAQKKPVLKKPSIEQISEKQKLIHQLLHEPIINAPKGEYNIATVDKWKQRYLGLDPEYHACGLTSEILRDRLIAGWKRLIKKDDLKTIYNASQKYHVKSVDGKEYPIPLDTIFLALGESHWDTKASSEAGAKGPWQFIEDTAKYFGLIKIIEVKKKKKKIRVDLRSNISASTDAAMRLLQDNYQTTKNWDRNCKFTEKEIKKITENDRWAYAFWCYNRGQGNVKEHYIKFRGQSAPYSHVLSQNPTNTKIYQSSQYVLKLFGIREAVKEMYKNPRAYKLG